jgi:hypothetical protein
VCYVWAGLFKFKWDVKQAAYTLSTFAHGLQGDRPLLQGWDCPMGVFKWPVTFLASGAPSRSV